MFRLTPVAKYLLIINIGLFVIATYILNIQDFIIHYFALRYIRAETFMPFQFITYMFLHANFWHLFGNMLALFFFGPALENLWGSKQFLIYYLATGLGAGILFASIDYFEKRDLERDANYYVVNPTPDGFSQFIAEHLPNDSRFADFLNDAYRVERAYHDNPNSGEMKSRSKSIVTAYSDRILNVPMLGASGAVFGILIGFGLLFPNATIFLFPIPFPIKAKYLVTFYAIYEIFWGIQRVPGDNVAHFAHIGGMLVGYLIIKFWFKGGNYQRF